MIIYSVDITVELDVQTDWLEWMTTVHIPEVLATNCFGDCKLRQVIEPAPQPDQMRFNIQYECKSLEEYRKYQETYAPELQKKHQEKFGAHYSATRQVLLPIKNITTQVVFDK